MSSSFVTIQKTESPSYCCSIVRHHLYILMQLPLCFHFLSPFSIEMQIIMAKKEMAEIQCSLSKQDSKDFFFFEGWGGRATKEGITFLSFCLAAASIRCFLIYYYLLFIFI